MLLGCCWYPIQVIRQNRLCRVPYVKAQLGPVALQAEFTYAVGKIELGRTPDLIHSHQHLVGPKKDVDISI